MKRSQKKSISRIYPFAILGAILLVLGIASYIYNRSSDKDGKPSNASSQGIDYSPATDNEKQESNDRKEQAADREEVPEPPSGNKQAVTPVIVDASQYAGQIEVRSYVPGIYEEGGTCTIRFTKGAQSVSKSVPASKDATTTRCANLAVPRSEFSEAGEWSVVVTYSSSAAEGSSPARTFGVE